MNLHVFHPCVKHVESSGSCQDTLDFLRLHKAPPEPHYTVYDPGASHKLYVIFYFMLWYIIHMNVMHILQLFSLAEQSP